MRFAKPLSPSPNRRRLFKRAGTGRSSAFHVGLEQFCGLENHIGSKARLLCRIRHAFVETRQARRTRRRDWKWTNRDAGWRGVRSLEFLRGVVPRVIAICERRACVDESERDTELHPRRYFLLRLRNSGSEAMA